MDEKVDRYEDERRRKADELIAMIRELREPLPQPTPLVYVPKSRRTTNRRLGSPDMLVGYPSPSTAGLDRECYTTQTT
jgi:hypothetical protein